MKVVVVDTHDGEGTFPTFRAGEVLHNLQACKESVHWFSCTLNGHDTYIPDVFVHDAVLAQDYNPTELVVSKDEILEVEKIVYEWLYCKTREGVYGWIPAEKVVSTLVQ